TCLLGHGRAAAYSMETNIAVVPDHARRRYLHDPRLTASPSCSHYVGRRRPATFVTGHVRDERVVVMAQDRKHLSLQRASDIGRLQNSRAVFVKGTFHIEQNGSRATAAPSRQFAQGVQLLSRIGHASSLVCDLRVRAEHDSILTHGGKYDGHS